MIEAKVIDTEPAIIHHRVCGEISETDAQLGADRAMSVARWVVESYGKFGLILDMRGYEVSNLKAHKVWSLEFKEQDLLANNVLKVAVVGDDSPKFEAEKE